MAANRKLGRASDQRRAILRNLTTALLWNGKIVTTEARAKEVRKIAEKFITLAIKEHNNTVMVKKQTADGEKEFRNDMPSKLSARRMMMSYLYNVPLTRKDDESKAQYKARLREITYPVVEKLFTELGPKYDKRSQEVGRGGYTRILKMGPRRGDAAEMVVLELV
ncbi:MAG: bL17 family ribosomal protein [Christensenellales bacterium]|jgi:large subunit ribosomal protein L17